MTQREIEQQAAMEILSFMEKHEIVDEDMISLILHLDDVMREDDCFVDAIGYRGKEGGINYIRSIANGEYNNAN